MKMRHTLTQYNNKIILNKKKPDTWEFPGDLVVRIHCFHCSDLGFSPWSVNWDPTAPSPPKKTYTKEHTPCDFIYIKFKNRQSYLPAREFIGRGWHCQEKQGHDCHAIHNDSYLWGWGVVMENGNKVRFYATGTALILDLGVHFRFFFKQCISII